jgi:hypothetical protein
VQALLARAVPSGAGRCACGRPRGSTDRSRRRPPGERPRRSARAFAVSPCKSLPYRRREARGQSPWRPVVPVEARFGDDNSGFSGTIQRELAACSWQPTHRKARTMPFLPAAGCPLRYC